MRFAHLLLAGYDGLRFAAGEHQDLVDGVDFIADVTSWRDLHCYQLGVEASMQDLSELTKGSLGRAEFLEVHHLVLWRARGHFGVFAHGG